MIADSSGRIFYGKDLKRKFDVEKLVELYKKNYKRIYIRNFIISDKDKIGEAIPYFLKLMKGKKIKFLKVGRKDLNLCSICNLGSNPKDFPYELSTWKCKDCGSEWINCVNMAINIREEGKVIESIKKENHGLR